MASFLLIPLLMASTAWAQGGGKKNKQKYSRQYNMNTVETISGEVTEVVYNRSQKNPNMMGVHLMVKTGTETLPVHLGPVWYIEQQESFEKGDKVTITGSRITFNNAPAMIAAKVERGDMILRLRDQQGFPAWHAWRMRNRMMNQ